MSRISWGNSAGLFRGARALAINVKSLYNLRSSFFLDGGWIFEKITFENLYKEVLIRLGGPPFRAVSWNQKEEEEA